MIFEIDRHTVTEGDVVEVKWDCTGSEQTVLTLDNGFRATEIPLEPSGTKRFRLNRSKGRTHLTIAVTMGGKTYRKKIAVRVKKMPTMKAETVDHRGRKVCRTAEPDTPLSNPYPPAEASAPTPSLF